MIRVSVTTLESFRRLVCTEWGDEAELLASIEGKPFKPSWQMDAGWAWQALIEGQHPEEFGDYVRLREFWFDAIQVQVAREHIGYGHVELKSTRQFDVGMPVTVVAMVDLIRGLQIQENKAKFSPVDARTYEPSLQWRFYLDIHDAMCVRYNLFSFADPQDDGFCDLKGITSFRFWRYVGLHEECRAWVHRFVEWADSRGVLHHLDRQEVAA